MISRLFILTIVATLMFNVNAAELKLASLFQENMVLQRDMDLPVWGTAKAGSEIEVTLDGETVKGVADAEGNWQVTLSSKKADGKKLKFSVKSGKESINFTNVVMGEVWICAGQSNMQRGYGRIPKVKGIAKTAKNIRTFNVPLGVSLKKEKFHGGKWTTRAPLSAVSVTFAIRLQEKINVPVGIILNPISGTAIESWLPRDLQEKLPHFKEFIDSAFTGDSKILFDDILANYNKTGKVEYSDDPKIAKLLKGKSSKIQKAAKVVTSKPFINYNTKMHPLAPYAVRGIAWYQGESNSSTLERMFQYGQTLPLWVQWLRQDFNNDKLNFIVVMLPGFGRCLNKVEDKLENPEGHSWAWMRESQMKVLDLPNTYIVNTIDLGDEEDIHPTDKAPIGARLALLARGKILGEDILAEGPVLEKVESSQGRLFVTFKNADGLKTLDGKAPKAFWICDNNKKWHRAKAEIKGMKVVLSSKAVTSPKYVRYAFSAMPEVNLINKAGLPARPFRTDNFLP